MAEHFMRIAFEEARNSEDPRTKVGACIVNRDGNVVGKGFNRFVKTLPEHKGTYPTVRECETFAEYFATKYPFMLFAETDAIIKSRPNCPSLEGCTLYTLIFPYYEGAKMMVELGLKKVVFYSDKYGDKPFTKAAKTILERAGVEVEEFQTINNDVETEFRALAKNTVLIPERGMYNNDISG